MKSPNFLHFGIAPSYRKIRLFLALAVTLSVYSSGSNADSAVFSHLEASGELPKLDRSSSIAGPDVDSNGIRDDIDAYLATKNYPAPQLAAAQQEARSFQNMLTVDISNQNALRRVSKADSKSTVCLAQKFSGLSENFTAVSATLEKLIVNTKERIKAYMAFNRSLDGTVFSLPQGDTCEK